MLPDNELEMTFSSKH